MKYFEIEHPDRKNINTEGTNINDNSQNNNNNSQSFEARPRRKKMVSLKKTAIFVISSLCLLVVLFLIFFLKQEAKHNHHQDTKKFQFPPTVKLTPNYQANSLGEKIRLVDIQGKGSHNSYEQGDYQQQLNINFHKPQSGACINVEIDLILEKSQENQTNNIISDYKYLVAHEAEEEQQDKTLDTVLKQINYWHQKNENHFPIIITLDLKESDLYEENQIEPSEAAKLINHYIEQNFNIPVELHTPKYYKKYNNLYQGIQENNWPKIQEQLADKLIFIISGFDYEKNVSKIKNYYADTWQNQYAFVDIDSRLITNKDHWPFINAIFPGQQLYDNVQEYQESNPNRIFYNQQLEPYEDEDIIIPWDQEEEFLKNIKDAIQQKLFVRGWVSNTEESWNKYKETGINIITTDYIFDKCWTVMDNKYFKKCLQQKQH